MQGHDEIVKSALELPEQERAQIVREILQSFDGEASADVETAWAQEVGQRIRDLTEGRATTVPAGEVLDQARSRIKRQR